MGTTNPLSYVNNCTNSIVIPLVTIAEVRQTILSMKNSSAGWDDFPAQVAKQSIDSYIEPLTCLINFFAKVFEKLLYKYLLDFFDDNDIFYQNQFGF